MPLSTIVLLSALVIVFPVFVVSLARTQVRCLPKKVVSTASDRRRRPF
jgi:hypothetical protein